MFSAATRLSIERAQMSNKKALPESGRACNSINYLSVISRTRYSPVMVRISG